MARSDVRRQAWLRSARAAGRGWRGYLVLLVVALAIVTTLAVDPTVAVRHGYIGVVLGALGLLLAVTTVGTTSPATDGRLAGQWGVEGVRTVRGWQVFDDVPTAAGDLDHVILSPAGPVAVAKRFHSQRYPGERGVARHERDLAAARRAAEMLSELMIAENLVDPVTGLPVEAVAALVVRGPGAPILPDGHRRDGDVYILDGNRPDRWMGLFGNSHLHAAVRRELSGVLSDLVDDQPTGPRTASVRAEIVAELRDGIVWERTTRRARRNLARTARRRITSDLVMPSPSAGTALARD